MADLFDQKAEDWDARPIPTLISEGVVSALLKNVELTPDMEVMDFGAGTGLLCSKIAPHVGKIYAVDISAAMLEKLGAKASLAGKVEILCRDILETPLDKKVGLIMSAMALHHVEDTGTLIAAFAGHLEVGGQLALADLDEEDGSFHPEGTEGVFHNGIARDRLQGLLEEHGFEQIEFVTALEVGKAERRYPIFLATATKR